MIGTIGNGGFAFDAVVIGAGMFGAYCAEKIFRESGKARRVLVLDAGSFLVSEHVQNLSNIGLGAGGAVRATVNGQEPSPQSQVANELAEIMALGDSIDATSAGKHYADSLALAEELGMRPLVAHCHLGLGKLYRRMGERQRTEEHLRLALTMYREMDIRFWPEQAGAELRELVRNAVDVDE